jgi:hypothetical protein
MPQVEFEHTIPVFQLSKTFLSLDCASTVNDLICFYFVKIGNSSLFVLIFFLFNYIVIHVSVPVISEFSDWNLFASWA